MITSYTPQGAVSITGEYFNQLVAEVAKRCYGVTAMGGDTTAQQIKGLVLGGAHAERGVHVEQRDGQLAIQLRIKVSYGLNIATIVRAITHKVKDEVEHATGLKVCRVDVRVEDILSAE